MLKKEREREILNIIKKQDGFITVKELCLKLYASESSIRRDLTALENRGIIKRSYGGAELITNYSQAIDFKARNYHNVDEKRIIAKKAASLIKDGNIIFLDQSSSALYLAHEILNKKNLTVITNNIGILSLLSSSKIKTICSGGTVSTSDRNCLVGSDASYIFENTYADFSFFSTKSLSDDGIISDPSREEVIVRQSIINNSAKKVFLCDSEKFGSRSAFVQCRLCDVDYLISENASAKRYSSLSDKLIIL